MQVSDLQRFFELVTDYRRKNPTHSLSCFMTGLQGEMLFKELLDLFRVEYSWTEKGVPQPFDFIVAGRKIEIKTVTYNMNYPNGGRQDLLVKKGNAQADYYVLVAESLDKGFYISGYVCHESLIASEQIKTDKGTSYRVTPDKLNPVSNMLNQLGV